MNIQNKINKVIEARKDAEKEHKYAKAGGKASEEYYWEGYLEGIDYALFILNELRNKQKKGNQGGQKTTNQNG